jgi:hypothetical protein
VDGEFTISPMNFTDETTDALVERAIESTLEEA